MRTVVVANLPSPDRFDRVVDRAAPIVQTSLNAHGIAKAGQGYIKASRIAVGQASISTDFWHTERAWLLALSQLRLSPNAQVTGGIVFPSSGKRHEKKKYCGDGD